MIILTQFWYPSFPHLPISSSPTSFLRSYSSSSTPPTTAPPCLKCQPRGGQCALVWMVWMPMSFLSKDSSGLSQKQVNAPRWHFEGYLQISCNHLCWKPWSILIFCVPVPGFSFKGSSVALGWPGSQKVSLEPLFFRDPLFFSWKVVALGWIFFFAVWTTYRGLEKFAHSQIWLVVLFSEVDFSELIWHTPASITCSLCL